MKIYAYEYCCYIMVVNKNITRDYFLEKAGIHGGYAKDMFCRLFDSIFAESENLLDSYGKYFHQEFSSLDEMLEKKYNVPQDIINQFTEEHIYEAIDTLYLVDRKIFCPTNGFYGQVLRALEYGTGKNKSYKIISEALRELAREVGKNEFIVKL